MPKSSVVAVKQTDFLLQERAFYKTFSEEMHSIKDNQQLSEKQDAKHVGLLFKLNHYLNRYIQDYRFNP